ncbi:hypothetical protein [Bradyrhizobium sp. USDA 3650]
MGPLIKCHDIDSDAESWMTILASIVNIALARFHLHGQQGAARSDAPAQEAAS